MTESAGSYGDKRAAFHLGIVQFFFITTWTVYVIYLPKLLTSVGIPPTFTPWILIIDQLIFVVMDVAMGFAADRAGRTLGRIGPMIVTITALSCIAFLMMPHASALGLGAAPLLLLILVWTVTSSALRAPLWVMTSRCTALSNLRWMNMLGLTGIALGGALAPYLGVALARTGPSLPFAISSFTLFLATIAAILIERSLGRKPVADASEVTSPVNLPKAWRPFLIGFFLLALGFQVHSALNSAPLYLRFADKEQLPFLLPLFWVGFNLAMFPGAYWAARFGDQTVMAAAAGLGVLGTLTSAHASSLDLLVAGQLVTGSAWGCAFMAGLSAALGFGRTGREGTALGFLFAALALATMIRIFVAANQWDKAPDLIDLLGWAPTTLWAAGCVTFVACLRMQR